TLYPLADTATTTGTLTGTVTVGGAPVFGAHVALDKDGLTIASGMTDPAGRFSISALPPGTYTPMVEPFNGPMLSTTLGRSFYRTQNTTFLSTIAQPVEVTAANSVDISIPIASGTWTLNPTTPSYGGGIPISPGGAAVTIGVVGNGMDRVGDSQFEVSGSGLHITRVQRTTSAGLPVGVLTVTADAGAAPGLRSIIVRAGDEVAFVPGCIRVR